MAASFTMLACAGTGLAGAFAPLPARKPDSNSAINSVSYAGPVISPEIGIPLPPVKPVRYNPITLTRDPVLTGDESVAAPIFSGVPLPRRKPTFAFPTAEVLLNYGISGPTPAAAPAAEAEEKAGEATADIPLPRPKPPTYSTDALDDRDAALYRKVFAAQATGDWDEANLVLRDIRDTRLRGHVMFQRYMHHGYKSSFEELQAWMSQYADLPGAERIYKLAQSRRPAGSGAALRKPANNIGIGIGTLHTKSGPDAHAAGKLTAVQKREIQRLVDSVNADISRGAPTRAARRLSADPASKLMDVAAYDQLRGQVANGYLLMGKPAEARSLASASAKRSGSKAPMAGWAGGLAAWRQHDFVTAAQLFEQTATSTYVSPWMRAAGAYWASRAHVRAGNMKDVSTWLREAARYPRTFYGMIATRALGWEFEFNWSAPDFSKDHFNTLASTPAGWRAMALVQAGQNHLAEAELLQINPKDLAVKEALIAYIQHEHLPALAMRVANNFERPDGGVYDAAVYPLLPWEPRGGYTVDRALIHAIARQESKFDTWALSPSGAVGLMQVLPSTAGYMMKNQKFHAGAGRQTLSQPDLNLEIGQKYVDYLMGMDDVGKDLLSLAIAYNAGPGNLRKWKRELADIDDPLLFIEMIPMAETRNYVERVLANYWVYAIRLGQPVPTLDSVVEGRQATYTPLDGPKLSTRLSQGSQVFRVASSIPGR